MRFRTEISPSAGDLFPGEQALPLSSIEAAVNPYILILTDSTRLDHGGKENGLSDAASVDGRAADGRALSKPRLGSEAPV